MTMQKNSTLSNIDIVVYALFILGGWRTRIHTEDIAIKCFELAPSKFSWVKYKQYPDLMTVWYALGDAEKTRYGGLVIGESERKKTKDKLGGWRLSSNGVSWIEQHKKRIELSLEVAASPSNRLQEDRRLKALMSSLAFKKYLGKGAQTEISYTEFVESIFCTVNTERRIVLERLEQLSSIAVVLRQAAVNEYLEYCRNRFLMQ